MRVQRLEWVVAPRRSGGAARRGRRGRITRETGARGRCHVPIWSARRTPSHTTPRARVQAVNAELCRGGGFVDARPAVLIPSALWQELLCSVDVDVTLAA